MVLILYLVQENCARFVSSHQKHALTHVIKCNCCLMKLFTAPRQLEISLYKTKIYGYGSIEVGRLFTVGLASFLRYSNE